MARTMGAGCLLWESELEVLPLNVDGNIEKSKVVLCKFHAIKPCERVSVSHMRKFLKGGDYYRENHWRSFAISRRKLDFSSW